jgi:hypothetical protein
MKTSTFKTVIVMLATLLFATHIFSQDLVGTRIDVQGSRFSTQAWIFCDPTTTRGFDNGWDVLESFNNDMSAPRICGYESDDRYKIDAVPELNNTYVGFMAGEDTVYTLTFNHQNIETAYSELYLIDSVARTITNIHANGSQYTFNAMPSMHCVRRFKIVTSSPTLPEVTLPTDSIPVDTMAMDTVPVDTMAMDTVVTAPVDTVSVPQSAPAAPSLLATDSHDMKVRVYSVNRTIFVNNTAKVSGALSFYNAQTGKVVKNFRYAAQTTTSMQFDGPAGIYIMNGAAGNGQISGKLLIE